MRGNLEASWQTLHKMWGFWDTYCIKGLLLLLSWFGEYSTMWTLGQGGLSILQAERRGGKSRLLMTGILKYHLETDLQRTQQIHSPLHTEEQFNNKEKEKYLLSSWNNFLHQKVFIYSEKMFFPWHLEVLM